MSAPRAADPPRWLDGALLALVAAAVFWPVRHFEFLLLDDDHFVTQNPMVRQGLSFDLVAWAFSTTEQGHFQPLTWLSHATDVSLFGLDAGAHHGTNLALHALATALCYLAFTRLTGRRDVGVVTALLYAVHPSRVEVVAWVSERKDLVCACFFFAALASWAAGRRVSTVVFYALALLAKPIALPLPLLLLLDRVAPLSGERRGPLTRRDLVSLAPPFALMLTFAGVAFAAQRGAGAMLSGPHAYEPGRAATHLWTYFARYAWPADVAILHPLKDVAPLTSAVALVALAAALAGCAVLLWRRRDAPLAFAFCAAVALLAPVCGLVQIGAQSTADRWLLLPVAFLTAALARVLPQRARLAVGLVAAAAFAVSTRAQLPTFSTSEAVLTRAVELDDANPLAWVNLGYLHESRAELPLAERCYAKAYALNPRSALAATNLGSLRAQAGDLEGARPWFEQALANEPAFGPAHYNLARALWVQGRLDLALPHYADAARLLPLDADAAMGHGAALTAVGRAAEARLELERATRLAPQNAEASAWLARAQRLTDLQPTAPGHPTVKEIR